MDNSFKESPRKLSSVTPGKERKVDVFETENKDYREVSNRFSLAETHTTSTEELRAETRPVH